MKLYKSGLALKREGTDETVAAFVSSDNADYVLAAVNDRVKNFERIEVLQDKAAKIGAERDECLEMIRQIEMKTKCYMSKVMARGLIKKYLSKD